MRLVRLLACGVAAASLWGSSAQAAVYYWDANTTTAGSGTAPAGTWGTDAFFNSSSTGGAGTFITTPLATDTAQFVAGPVAGMGAYTVDVNGTQSIAGIIFRQTGTITLGNTVNGSTINLGAGGLDNGTRTIVSGSDSGGVIINSTLNLTADQTWSTNNITASQPPFTIAGDTTGTANLTLTQGANRAFTVSGNLGYTGSLTFSGGNGNSTFTISGLIGPTVTNLTVNTGASSNAPTLTRAAGNTYGGTTTITRGKLLLTNTSGSATGTSAIALSGGSANAVLGGSGFSTGILTVTAGSRIAPGLSPTTSNFGTVGTLTVGATTLTSTNLDFDLAATTALASDKLVTGALTLGATVVLNITAANSGNAVLQAGSTYLLIDSSNAGALDLSGTTFTTNFNGALAGGYSALYSSNGTGDLLVTFTAAVPEPSTYVGVSLLLAVLVWRERRRFAGRFGVRA